MTRPALTEDPNRRPTNQHNTNPRAKKRVRGKQGKFYAHMSAKYERG